jgi:PPOX class probable F420-dependent enzyme
VQLPKAQCHERLAAADHAVLCTANPDGLVDAVPICFAINDDVAVTAVDNVKAKQTTQLTRVTNLARDPKATLLVEHWDPDDWSQLWWVRARVTVRPGHATDPTLYDECEAALRSKYAPYKDAVFARIIIFDLVQLTGWSAAD